ncbi:hypothetical protein AGMMS50293_04230 [Spirochaetia bacterium]|nr:hypothetical protein AGMMS50293_04230 [Spirochaetia bacterium]
MPFVAVIVKWCSPTAVVPAMVISPVELLIDTPVGCPIKEYVIGIVPVAITWKVPPTPFTTVVLFTEMIDGAPDETPESCTVRVKPCVAFGSVASRNVPFTAVIVK